MRFPLLLAAILSLSACGGGGGGGGDGGSSTPPPERDWSLQMNVTSGADADGDIYADVPMTFRLTPSYAPYGVAHAPAPAITVKVYSGGALVSTGTITDATCGDAYDLDLTAADWGAFHGPNNVSVTATLGTEAGRTDPDRYNNVRAWGRTLTPRVDGSYVTARSSGADPQTVSIGTGTPATLTLAGTYRSRSINGTASVVGGAFTYAIPITNAGPYLQYQATITGTVTVLRQMAYTIQMQERTLNVGVGWGSWSTYTSTWTGGVGAGG